MKKTYTKPELEITAFTTEDIITASGITTGSMTAGGSVDTESASGIKVDLSKLDWQ